MTDAVMVALITTFPASLGAALSIWNNILARKHTADIEETKKAMVTLELNTNSIKDELVKVTGQKAFAEGVKEGREQENEESRG